MALPQLVYGTSFLGINDLDAEEESLRLLEYVYSHGIRIIDTADLYPPLGEHGKSERIIARFIRERPDVKVWTKTAVTGDWSGRGNLKRDLILDSAKASHERLGVKFDMYFMHTPDPITPYSESIQAFAELEEAGLFEALGLSNFSFEQTQRWCQAVKERPGFPMPKGAQWQYNPLCRHIENDLLPLYREKGIPFIAYSPLAGGFLTGKVTEGRKAKSRFDYEHFPPGKLLYGDQYDKPAFHEAYKLLKAEADKLDIDVPNASLRWLIHHSALCEGDHIIYGSTKFSQAEQIFEGLHANKGPLPQSMLDALDRAWDLVKNEKIIRHGVEGHDGEGKASSVEVSYGAMVEESGQ